MDRCKHHVDPPKPAPGLLRETNRDPGYTCAYGRRHQNDFLFLLLLPFFDRCFFPPPADGSFPRWHWGGHGQPIFSPLFTRTLFSSTQKPQPNSNKDLVLLSHLCSRSFQYIYTVGSQRPWVVWGTRLSPTQRCVLPIKAKISCRAEKDCIGTASPTSTSGPISVLVVIYAVRISIQSKHDGSRQSI